MSANWVFTLVTLTLSVRTPLEVMSASAGVATVATEGYAMVYLASYNSVF